MQLRRLVCRISYEWNYIKMIIGDCLNVLPRYVGLRMTRWIAFRRNLPITLVIVYMFDGEERVPINKMDLNFKRFCQWYFQKGHVSVSFDIG